MKFENEGVNEESDIIFSRKCDVLLAEKDKWVVRMISMIHDTSVSTTGKKLKGRREYCRTYQHQGM